MAEQKSYPTPHIAATPNDFARTVLMPGDPLRAKFIAENFLEGARCVNNVRNIQGYTGLYKGAPVSVMASGMGMPSIGIYSHELYAFFGVENIIRIGSAGAIQPNLRLRQLLFAAGASTDSAFGRQFGTDGAFAPIADFTLLKTAVGEAEKLGASYAVGNVLSSDRYYNDDPHVNDAWQKMGVLAIEMEAAALYMNAARQRKRALAMFTVSNHILTGEGLSSKEIETSFTEMMTVALNTAVAMQEA